MGSEIMRFLEEKKDIIDESIEKYLPKKIDEKYIEWLLGKPSYEYTTKTIQEALSKPIWDFLSRGGKRWRPAL
ncbi:MAG: polyprenyl synthetase family protein, partial [Nitrososphaeria archaeon]|nr:polyprenyl synthetase family protein [Nitrososphaeria archaeon]